MARAHRPILVRGLGGERPLADFGRGAGWRARIGRFWPGGWAARAHPPILAGGLAGWRAPIVRIWPGG